MTQNCVQNVSLRTLNEENTWKIYDVRTDSKIIFKWMLEERQVSVVVVCVKSVTELRVSQKASSILGLFKDVSSTALLFTGGIVLVAEKKGRRKFVYLMSHRWNRKMEGTDLLFCTMQTG